MLLRHDVPLEHAASSLDRIPCSCFASNRDYFKCFLIFADIKIFVLLVSLVVASAELLSGGKKGK